MSSETKAKEEVKEMKPNFFLIDERLVGALGGYLMNKPMLEVEELVKGLRSLQPVSVEEKPKEEGDSK